MPKSFPDWLTEEQPAQPTQPAGRFLTKNLLNLSHVLAHFNESHHVMATKTSAWVEVITLLVTITVTMVCQNGLLLWLLLLLQLLTLMQLPGALMNGVLHGTLRATLISGIVILPSLLITNWVTALWWLARLALVMLAVQSFRHRVSWRTLLVALRQLHVPSLFILTLDITVKYSHVLGSRLQTNLEAVWLRSGGHLTHPLALATRLMGLLYLQSRHQATELYQAMWLRGYTETPARTHLQWHMADWGLVVRNVLIVGLAVWLGHR